jgi:hypothetical protein
MCDISFLKALKTILDSKTNTGVIQLNQEQPDEIIAANKEIDQLLSLQPILFRLRTNTATGTTFFQAWLCKNCAMVACKHLQVIICF